VSQKNDHAPPDRRIDVRADGRRAVQVGSLPEPAGPGLSSLEERRSSTARILPTARPAAAQVSAPRGRQMRDRRKLRDAV
jgi:hypothetical protein